MSLLSLLFLHWSPTVASARPAKPGAKHKGTGEQPKTRVDPGSGTELVYLPGGGIHVGCERADQHCFSDEKPGREARVVGFWMAKTPATLSQYEACMAAGTCTAPATGGSCNYRVAGRAQHPVNCIDWQQANQFCGWMGARLPTAEEWEYAAKGGEHRIYPWGDEEVTGERANFCEKRCFELHPDWTWTDRSKDDGWASTSPVGTYPAGASKHGLLDVAGNAGQWTSSDYGVGLKEVRGGAWDVYPRYVRNSARVKLRPSGWFDNVSVRCAQ